MKPIAVDLFCGLGGWADGLLEEGYRVVGFDIERHDYGTGGYPGQLVLQDINTIHGRQFKDAALIVASPPCQAYSYRAMPWRRAKALPPPDNTLFEACFRIQREAIDAAGGRFIPLVVENVCGVQPFVGRARWHYGSFYLWGDVPALMPLTTKRGVKVGGLDWSSPDRAKRGCFRDSAIKNTGGSGFAVAHNTTSGKGRNPDGRGVKNGGRAFPNDCAEARTDLEVKCGGDWFWKGANASLMRRQASKSSKRKLASALIAKIPRPLSRWIGKAWFPA